MRGDAKHHSSTAATQNFEMRSFPLPYEADLKAAVVDRLFDSGVVDEDAVIISEMVIADWTRRADIVLANGSLVAFEIKSPADSLSRLEGQLASLRQSFEKVILVVAPRFEEKVLQIAGDGVGVWVANRDGELKERQRAKKKALSRQAAVNLMTTAELRRLLLCNGVTGHRLARHELYELALRLPDADLANAARNAVKARHRARHEAFVSDRTKRGTLSAVADLHRKDKKHRPSIEKDVGAEHFAEPDSEHPLFVNAPAGPVLRRRINR